LQRQRGNSAGADKAGQIRATSEPPDGSLGGETTVNLATEPPPLGEYEPLAAGPPWSYLLLRY